MLKKKNRYQSDSRRKQRNERVIMLQVNIRKSRTVRDFTTDLHKLIY